MRAAATTIDVRVTEYTVGASGSAAMPDTLPANSGFTYAVDFQDDRAQGANVQFSQPVPYYTENFLSFPVGTNVPTGYYDNQKGLWVASDNGRVIKILSISGGKADLDIDGSGTAANATALANLGVTSAEQQTLATVYAVGQSL